MNLKEAPRLCWAWNDAGRKTSPSLQWIREIKPNEDGTRQGIGLNGYPWLRVQPIEEGHPDAAKEAALRKNYGSQVTTAIYEASNVAIRSIDPGLFVPSGVGSTTPWPKRLASTLTTETPQHAPSALSRIWARIRGRG